MNGSTSGLMRVKKAFKRSLYQLCAGQFVPYHRLREQLLAHVYPTTPTASLHPKHSQLLLHEIRDEVVSLSCQLGFSILLGSDVLPVFPSRASRQPSSSASLRRSFSSQQRHPWRLRASYLQRKGSKAPASDVVPQQHVRPLSCNPSRGTERWLNCCVVFYLVIGCVPLRYAILLKYTLLKNTSLINRYYT